MEQIVKLQDIPETLDMQELMEVKGGVSGGGPICIFSVAVKVECNVEGSGVVQPPADPDPGPVKS